MKKNRRIIASAAKYTVAVEFAALEPRLMMCLTLDDPDHCADCVANAGSPVVRSAITMRTLARSKLGLLIGNSRSMPDSMVVMGPTNGAETISANVPVAQVPILHSHSSSTH